METEGASCRYIETKAECEAAATALGLSDTTAEDGTKTSQPGTDAPYCFFEDGDLFFDGAGTNTGACGNAWNGNPNYLDICLCHKEGECGWRIIN